jgi:drug/metabolite transporter (DMT)-like permease
LLTGVVQTLCAQTAFYQGGAEKTTLLPVLANFAGIACALFLPSSSHETTSHDNEASSSKRKPAITSHHKKFALIGSCEVAGNVLGVLGLIFAGSGLFQVVYASVVLFTALLSKIFLGRSPQPKQWAALFLITCGLAISAVGTSSSAKAVTTTPVADTTRDTLIGILLTLLCAIFYSSSYIIVEWTLSSPDAPSERNVQAYAGLYGLTMISIYTLLHTIPNWDVLVVANVAAKKGQLSNVFIAYFTLALAGFLHSVSYFKLMSSVGAVSTGVLQSLRAVSVFGISSIAFCSTHSEQCVTNAKMMSMAIVCIGLVAYSTYAVPRKSSEEKIEAKP